MQERDRRTGTGRGEGRENDDDDDGSSEGGRPGRSDGTSTPRSYSIFRLIFFAHASLKFEWH